ncbi:protein RETICULATA-RELATED 3, chloroplastic-like [Macadamia integrifolia]|uniref:protein RETICULATA-RELATED 3, chloroplastic-like n=1 Tax=Macadamia integrifolia TaxID=60698 RepID=UPI001C4EAFDF|nr:protein RETICULATA-RELATED 3, chloroplastic-like [Macadamia integrifolia]
MATTAQLRYSPLPSHHRIAGKRSFPGEASFFPSISFPVHSATTSTNLSLTLLQPRASNSANSASKIKLSSDGGNNGGGIGRGTGGGGSGDGWSSGGSKDGDSSGDPGFGILGLFLNGWRSRVAADPQFPFKVLMEELVGVTACVLGDMASRPNFGLNELDFVFSTLVVGSILNFVLMYLLAPTMSASSSSLPAIFASCPQSHMFESGAYSVLDRLGTFVYKGTVFAAVGFAAGLVGTALSNGLIKLRKKMDPSFETPNKPPPTLLNAFTWALHMGLSSNFRYQTLNGIEFLLAKGLPPVAFKSSVVVLRCLNNVLGGVSFVVLARLTGAQKGGNTEVAVPVTGSAEEKVKLLEGGEDLQSSESTCK